MLSCPPAMTISASPLLMACAPNITALRLEPHTILIVNAGTSLGKPAFITD